MANAQILIVEDDRVIVKITEWRLNKLGYEVCGKAETGAEALDIVVQKNPDLVLLDINLKGAPDGFETAKRIKKEFNIPVIIVTAHSDGAILTKAKEIRPDGFILIPFDDTDLKVKIQLALKK
jgi:CheY-like chemotaxis protein